jgi:hypothetical protein
LATLRRGHLRPQELAQQEQRRFDHPEGVPHLVPDPGGELSDRRQPLGGAVPGDQVLSIGLQHDGQLDVQDLVDGVGDPRGVGRRVTAQLVADDVQQAQPDAVHGREHERLREPDLDVDASDAGAPLIVGLVVRAQQQPPQPVRQRLLQPFDLRRTARDRDPRVRMRVDGRVEVIDDRDEEALRERMQRAQRRRRLLREADIVGEALEGGHVASKGRASGPFPPVHRPAQRPAR